VLILPLYQPFRLAEEVAMLDVLSKGRVILGVASGYRERDFRNMGKSIKDRGEVMEESLTLLSRLLTETDVSYSGKHFRVEAATIQPRPVQQPRPPIWVGGWKRPALERAARLGDAWFPGPTASFETVLQCKKIYEEQLSLLSRRREKGLPIVRDVYVAESTEKAFRESEASFTHMYQDDYSTSGHPLVGGAVMSFVDWAADRFVIGDPQSVIEQLSKIHKHGFDKFIFRVSLRRLTDVQVRSCIRILGEKVLPYLRTA
jgi:alkanesulfonate monooxygenase SsuD/methylene tetrahydromethanopterin reductase-like flavin-dependent oxidoreductase (luciferase family)